MSDKRIIDYAAESAIQANDILLLSDPSANYTKVTIQQLCNYLGAVLRTAKRASCDTAAATAAKVVTISDYAAIDGVPVIVTFENAVPAGATLTVNGQTAVPIKYHGAAIAAGTIQAGDTALLVYSGGANAAYDLITVDRAGSEKPDGGWTAEDLAEAVRNALKPNGGWTVNDLAEVLQNTIGGAIQPGDNMVKLGEGYGTCSTPASTTAKVVQINDFAKTVGATVTVEFQYAVPNNATLNIKKSNSSYTGAHSIYYKGEAIKAGVINAGDVATFRYDSNGNVNVYRLISVSPKNYGTANADKPVVIDQNGNPTPGSWPSGSGGGTTQIMGFANVAAFRTFKQDYPTALNLGDYVIIREGQYAHASHTFYKVVNPTGQNWPSSDGLNRVYSINDKLIVTVTNNNGSYSVDKTFAQIVTALADGQEALLVTDFGPVLEATYFDATDSIKFSGVVESSAGAFFIVSYKINSSGVTARSTMADFIPIVVTESSGVYDISYMPPFINSVADLVAAKQAGAEICLVYSTGNYEYIHPFVQHYGNAEIKFVGPEIVNDNGTEKLSTVVYTLSTNSAHVARSVGPYLPKPASGTAQNPSADKGKVPTVNDLGEFELQPHSSYTGPAIPQPESGDAGKILTVDADLAYALTNVATWNNGGTY